MLVLAPAREKHGEPVISMVLLSRSKARRKIKKKRGIDL
jgi:hypothetical protein